MKTDKIYHCDKKIFHSDELITVIEFIIAMKIYR